MRIPRVFIDAQIDVGSQLEIPRDPAHHLRHVLRLGDGSAIRLFNGRATADYDARLQIHGKQTRAIVGARTVKHNDPTTDITLIQAMGRGEHVDFIVQKATELGASSLILFNANRTQSPLKPARIDKKLTHWTAIAQNACEQCDRNLVPSLRVATSIEECMEFLPAANRLLLDFNGTAFLDLREEFTGRRPFQILTGPEGGLDEQEIELARESGFRGCLLGPRTLRMETAAIAALTLVQHHFGDL